MHETMTEKEVSLLVCPCFAQSPETKAILEYVKSSSYSYHNQGGCEPTFLTSLECLNTRLCYIRMLLSIPLFFIPKRLLGQELVPWYYKSQMNALTSTPSIFLSLSASGSIYI